MVKNNCLYELVNVKDPVIPVKLADFVPVLVAEITRDDGTEQTKQFKVSAIHKSGITLPVKQIYVHRNEDKSLDVRFEFNGDFEDSSAIYTEEESA